MKFSRLSAIPALMLPLLTAFATELPFSGKWTSIEMVAGQNKPYSTFTVTVDEDETGNIHGAYCFIAQAGNRIDCSPDRELNISGRVEGDKKTATVSFYSFFGGTGGLAEIIVNGDWLIWNVVKQPKGGDYYGPLRVKMHRDTSAESHSGERMVVADKAFLYDTPSHSQASRVYVIKGDYMKLLNISSDLRFWKIEFVSKDGRHIIKWIDCADIGFCAQ